MLLESQMHEYQRHAVDFIQDKKRCGLFLDMGLGKSVSSLTAISNLSDSFAIRKTLVIAPLRVANSVWQQEAAKWQHTSGLKVSVCTGSEKTRMAALMVTADVYVINRENVPWLVKHHGAKWSFDCVVIDESSSFKSNSSQRFKALKRILPDTTHMVLLTGTPGSLLDLWAQMYLIDFGERLGRTKGAYERRFFEADYMGYKLTPKRGAAEEIYALIGDVVLSMSAEDYLELPERISLFEKVQLPAKAMAQYLEFEKEMFADLPNGEEVEAQTAAALAGKLLQFSNGAMYHDEHKNWSELHTAKLDALAEIIEENDGENILVAYNFKHDLARLQARFPSAIVLDKKQSTIERWNTGDIKILLAHPQSAGHGINLQQGGCVAVWFGLNWSLELYQQFNARLHRQGQGRPVRIIHIVAEGCIDERVCEVLAQKDAVQADLLKALKKA